MVCVEGVSSNSRRHTLCLHPRSLSRMPQRPTALARRPGVRPFLRRLSPSPFSTDTTGPGLRLPFESHWHRVLVAGRDLPARRAECPAIPQSIRAVHRHCTGSTPVQ